MIYFYVGTSIAKKDAAKGASLFFESMNGGKTFCNAARWFDMDPVDQTSELALTDRAVFDLNGIECARFAIFLMPAGYGTHVEIGAAIQRGIPIYMYAPTDKLNDADYKCVFHYHPRIQRFTNMYDMLSTIVSDYLSGGFRAR